MCISTVHPRPNTPLITSYLLPLTSKRSADRLSDTPSRHIPTRSFWLFTSFGRAGRCRSRGMRLDTAHAVRTHLGSCPAASILPRNTLERSPHCDRAAGLPRYTSPTPHLHSSIRRRDWRARREARAGREGCWGCSRALGRRRARRSGRDSGQNGAYSHASEIMSVECKFSAFCGALAL